MTAVAAPARLIRVVPGKDRPRCLILPGSGAGFVPYLRLAASFGTTLGLSVDFVRTVGLMLEESPEESVPQMADSVLDVLDESSAMPWSVLGWSLGGLVAWELCVRLAVRGHRPNLVIVDSSPLPRVPEPGEDERIRDKMISELGSRADRQTVDRVVRTFEMQSAALADYEARQSYPGRTLLLTCAPQNTAGQVAAVRRWKELAPHLETDRLDAGHDEVFEPAHLPQLTEAVGAFFGRTEEARP